MPTMIVIVDGNGIIFTDQQSPILSCNKFNEFIRTIFISQSIN